MKPTETCKKCGKPAFKNEGISKKNGKPYANIKCPSCEAIEWLKVEEEKPASKPAPEGWQKPVFPSPISENALPKSNSEMILLEEIQALRKEIRQLVKLVLSNLGEEVPLSDEV